MTSDFNTEVPHQAALRVLGPAVLELDAHAFDVGLWRRGPQNLLKLVATSPGRRRLRDEVIGLLWPDSTTSAGASNLRHALHLLRHAVGDVPSLIVIEGNWLVLNPVFRWWVDVEEFEQLAHVGEDDRAVLEHVVALYRGDALPENRYDDWAEGIRTRCERTWKELALRLAALDESEVRLETASHLYERILDGDPLDEVALQGLLRVLILLGRRTQALRRYAVFEQRLEEEIGVPPDEETAEIVRELRVKNSAVTRTVPPIQITEPVLRDIEPSYPLQRSGLCVGRDQETAEIVGRVFDRQSVLPRLMLIAAEAGTGKTWLLGEVARQVRQRGALVLAGGCYEHEGSLPYGPIHDALLDYVRALPEDELRIELGPLSAELSRIVPEIRDRIGEVQTAMFADVEAQRLQLFTGVARTLARFAERRPVLVLLDDLHWADESTLHLLHFLARQRDLPGMVIVGAYREEELLANSPLSDLVNSDSRETETTRILHIEGLTKESLARLLADRLDAPGSDEFVRQIHGRSGGNPFFALQIVRLLQQEGRLELTGGEWCVSPGAAVSLPQAVRETVTYRLRRLQPSTREILTLSAVMGRQFSYPALNLIWHGSEEDLIRELDDALEAHVLSETDEGFVFRHPLLHEVVYTRIPQHVRARLHERAGLALEAVYGSEADAHATELAHHFAIAASSQAVRAIHYLLQGGRQAERAFEHAEAERMYRRAIAVTSGGDLCALDPQGLETAPVLERLSDVLALQGRFDEALASLEQAAAIHARAEDWEREALALAHIGRVLWKTGQVAFGIERIQVFLTGERTPSQAEARLLLTLALLHKMRGDYHESLAAAEQARWIAEAIEDDETLIDIALARQDALFNIGEMAAAQALLEKVIPQLEVRDDLLRLRLALNDLGVVCWLRGRLDQSAAALTRALSLAERIGDPTWIALGNTVLGHTFFFAGTWREARVYLERGLTLVRELSENWVWAYSYACLGALDVAEGEWRAAVPLLERAIELAGRESNMEVLPYPHALLGEIDLLRAEPDRACERFAPLLEGESSGVTLMLPVAAQAFLDRGEIDRAEIQAERAIVLMRGRTEVVLPDALRVLGNVRAQQGRWAEAEMALQEAIEGARRNATPLAEARALLAWGVACQKQGRTDEGIQAVERSRAIFRRLGAKPWIFPTAPATIAGPQSPGPPETRGV